MKTDASPAIRCESREFQTADGITLHCLHWKTIIERDERIRPPVVLLHGGGANAHWWDGLAGRLALAGPVYALDFRGHGDSDYPTRRFVGAFNVDLEEVLAWIGREDAYLVGHSLGAAVALDHASRFPSTRGIVFVDPARGGPPGGGRRARLALAHRRSYRTREDAIRRFRFLPESHLGDEKIRVEIAEHSIRPESDGRFGYKFDPKWFSLPSRPLLVSALHGHGIPALQQLVAATIGLHDIDVVLPWAFNDRLRELLNEDRAALDAYIGTAH